jgi:hypothetical protein
VDYNTLSNEINQPQYAGMSDAEIAAALNAPGASTRRRVPIADLQARAMETGVYTALRVVVGNAQAPSELRAMAQTVLDLANARFADIDLDNSASRQMFGALQQAGVISQQQAAQIDALATVPGRSRAQEIGLGVVVEVDIAAAWDWIAAQEAEATRRAAYDLLRERLINGPRAVLSSLQVMQYDGTPAPNWDEVLTWL